MQSGRHNIRFIRSLLHEEGCLPELQVEDTRRACSRMGAPQVPQMRRLTGALLASPKGRIASEHR